MRALLCITSLVQNASEHARAPAPQNNNKPRAANAASTAAHSQAHIHRCSHARRCVATSACNLVRQIGVTNSRKTCAQSVCTYGHIYVRSTNCNFRTRASRALRSHDRTSASAPSYTRVCTCVRVCVWQYGKCACARLTYVRVCPTRSCARNSISIHITDINVWPQTFCALRCGGRARAQAPIEHCCRCCCC